MNTNTLDKNNVENIYSLTKMQESMLFTYLQNPDTLEYFEQLAIHIEGELDTDLLKASIEKCTENNEALRTVFRWRNISNPIQIVLKNKPVIFNVVKLSDDSDKKQQIKDFCNRDMNMPIELETAPIRFAVCTDEKNVHTLVITNHHMIYDGWSNGVILREIFNNYLNLKDNKPVSFMPKMRINKYLEWLNSDKESEKKFWKGYLSGFETITDLPSSKTDTKKHDMKNYFSFVSEEQMEKLNTFSSNHNVSLASILYSAWGVLLQKYNDVDESVFGITVSGRNGTFDNIENTVGLFINTLPIRVCGKSSFTSIIRKTGTDVTDLNENARLHISDIIKLSDAAGDELFDSIFVVENYPLNMNYAQNNEFRITDYEMNETTNFNLTFEFTVFNRRIAVNYNSEKWDELDVAKVVCNFNRLIDLITLDPESCPDDFELVDENEKKLIMEDFNDSHYRYEKGDTICSLFLKQAEKTPDNIALTFLNTKLTYSQLNEKICEMSSCISKYAPEKGDRIGIVLNRSIEMIISMLAVMRLGCAYIPIDINYPDDRINYIIDQSNCKIIISNSAVDFDFAGKIRINADNCSDTENCTEVPACVEDGLPAYIIYTSGSTGEPNGVVVKHRSIVNTLIWRKEYYGFSEKDSVLQLPSFSFDSSVEDIFTPLISGGKLCLVTEEQRHDLSAVRDIIKEERITHILSVPSYYKTLIKEIPDAVSVMKFVTIAGEDFNIDLVHEHFKIAPNTQLFNEYGPTENSVCSTVYEFRADSQEVLIGKPISNVECYILNKKGQLCPIGIAGELCVAGDGLTEGYLNNKELTEKKFTYNKYLNRMIYKTGDITAFNTDGNIRFVGRIDHQIKIRGFRIETDEIITAVTSFLTVNDACIIEVKKQEISSIACFFTADHVVNVAELKDHLEKRLPKYMVPSYLVQIDKIPLTHNGKTDNKRLREMLNSIETTRVIKRPSDDNERRILSIWQELLEKDDISTDNNFFDVGGDSLSLMCLFMRITRVYKVDLTVADLIDSITVEKMARKIEQLLDSEVQDNDENNLKSILISEEYRNTENEKNTVHNSNTIEVDSLDSIFAVYNDKGILNEAVILTAYVYELFEMAASKYISVVADCNGRFKNICVNTEKLESVDELLSEINKQFKSDVFMKNEDINKVHPSLDRNKITVGFSISDTSKDIINRFDVFMVLKKGMLYYSFDYLFNNGKLSSAAIKKITNEFIPVINAISADH